jgi:hypothetical protein
MPWFSWASYLVKKSDADVPSLLQYNINHQDRSPVASKTFSHIIPLSDFALLMFRSVPYMVENDALLCL